MQDANTTAAVALALKCDWIPAIRANAKILKDFPNDIDCLNRLGKAHLELGNNKKAAAFFRKVLKIDKYNPIALKNLDRLATAKVVNKKSNPPQVISFLEEPGKTKLVTLVNPAPASVLMQQSHADTLNLFSKRHTVVVQDQQGTYVGALPDDLGHRLSILIKGGNRYEAIIKSISRHSMIIFLREIVRSKKFHNTPSFLNTNGGDYLSFLRDESEDTKIPVTTSSDDSETDEEEAAIHRSKFGHDDEEETP